MADLTKKPVIVVVDDDDLNHVYIRRVLTKDEWEVHSITEAKDAAGHIRQLQPDLVILDNRMPLLDGHQVLEEIRAYDTNQDIIVAYTSAADPPEDILEKVDKLGAHLLSKDATASKNLPNLLRNLIANSSHGAR